MSWQPELILRTSTAIPPKLIARGDGQFEFERSVDFEDEEKFDEALEVFQTGACLKAGKLLRKFLKTFAYHIDSYHHLGVIEHDLKHRDRAFKYFEMGYRIGMLSVSMGFSGQLPWNCLGNRPFLRAAHAYGLALDAKGRRLEAAEIYEQILSWNPNDNQGIRCLLPSLYVAAKANTKARDALELYGMDCMNAYTRCLVEIQDGFFFEAIRWLCRGLSYNLHFPSMAIAKDTLLPKEDRFDVAMCSPEEAAENVALAHTLST